jgi:hypothetical protein
MDKQTTREGANRRRLPLKALTTAVGSATLLLLAYAYAIHSILVGVLLLMAAGLGLLIGSVVGFLFAIPGNQPMAIDGSEGSAQHTSITDGQSRVQAVHYAPSTKLNEIADWLVKMLVGAGLVGARQIGQTVAQLGELLAGSIAPPQPSVSLATQLSVYIYTILGFGSVFLWTRISYSAIQTLADQNIQGELEELKVQISSSSLAATQAATGVERVSRVAQWLASRDRVPKASTHTGEHAHPDAVRLREEWPTAVRERFTQFQKGSTDWDADPAADNFPDAPAELNGRCLEAELLLTEKGSVVFEARVVRTAGGGPITQPVTFLLHPSLDSPVLEVDPATDDSAAVVAYADGWFTIVAIADGGDTILSYSLRNLKGAPAEFAED